MAMFPSAGRVRTILASVLAFGAASLASNPAPAASTPAKASPAQPAPAAQTVPAQPGATTASFGDWVLRCQRVKDAAEAPRVCEVGESIQVQGQANPIARVAIGRLNKTDPLRTTILLPTNISLPSIVHIGLAPPDAAGVDLSWRRCLPGACVADAEIKDDTLKLWRGATDVGRIAFKDAAGRDVVVPVSFKGLAQALDALAAESRQP